MKKLTMICVTAALIPAFAARTQADMTITDVDVVDATSGQPNTYFEQNRFYDQDWGWTHSFTPPADISAVITGATLEIDAFDIDFGELDLIEADGILLGQLVAGGNDAPSGTVFNLTGPVLDEMLDGTLDIWMDIGSVNQNYVHLYAAYLNSSTLTVNYEPVPVPAAFILGSIGLSLAGWRLRRYA